MSASIIQEDKEYCFIHKQYLNVLVPANHEHHCLHGSFRRKLAEEDGLKIYLCVNCHTALHDRGFHDLDVQQLAQETWMNHYGKTVDDFITRYGKSYL